MAGRYEMTDPIIQPKTIFNISKTTIAGILSAIIGAAGPLTAYLATVQNPKAATAAGIVTLLATIARVWVGLLQGDAPPQGK